MAKAIFNVLFKVLVSIANLILLPINTMLNTFVPNLSQAISNLTDAINVFLGDGLAYFFNFLPPISKYFIIFYLGFLVVYYTVSYSVHGVVWLIHVLKKLPLA